MFGGAASGLLDVGDDLGHVVVLLAAKLTGRHARRGGQDRPDDRLLHAEDFGEVLVLRDRKSVV